MSTISHRNFESEISFQTSRSSGPGGQNVNKVNSKVELRFHISSSHLLSEFEKSKIHKNLKSRINSDGELILVSQENRSQLRNKEMVLARFYELIEKALKPQKKRYKTKPTLASKLRRLEGKHKHALKKRNRKLPED